MNTDHRVCGLLNTFSTKIDSVEKYSIYEEPSKTVKIYSKCY